MSQAGAPADKAHTHMQRLQDLEQHVIRAVDIAATVIEELSNLGPTMNKDKIKQLCEEYMNQVQAAQMLVQEGAANPIVERGFTAMAYFPMCRAYMANEKVQAVSLQVSGMLEAFANRTDSRGQRQEQPSSAQVALTQGPADMEVL